MWETIWTFHTKNFRVDFDVSAETDLDLSWDEDGSARAGIESGKFVAFVACVRVWHAGMELGSEYLGECIYESPEAFIDHRGLAAKSRKDGTQYGSYFSDMVRSAIAESRRMLCNVPRLRCA